MQIVCKAAGKEDIEALYRLNRELIDAYEAVEQIDYDGVLRWVRRKLERCIGEYTVVYAEGEKAGYYHFFRNEEGEYELDDLYVFPQFQGKGIGTEVVDRCCRSVSGPVMLYVFRKNQRAMALYERLGFRVAQNVGESRCIMRRPCQSPRYYAAYEERYRTAHARGVSWASDAETPIVSEVMARYHIGRDQRVLEIGCGEGRDSRGVLARGYCLTATDLSQEAIAYCRQKTPQWAGSFRVLDCLCDRLEGQFEFIFGVAVVHMLVLDADRARFYQFIRSHLSEDGLALICTMGDGTFEMQSDPATAFTPQERNHPSGKMVVAGTSCRMVSFKTFEGELARGGLQIVEKGVTEAPPEFDRLMYAVVRRA